MSSAGSARDAAAVWDIATPLRPGRLPGVSMAGFRARAGDLVDLEPVPYPAITVVVDLAEALLVIDDATGRQERGSVVAGLAPDAVRALGRDIDCLQVRLSPVVAHAVLGASPELGGTVVALDDLWGRDATRTEEQLRAAASWDDWFAIVEAALARRHEAGRAVSPEVARHGSWGRDCGSGTTAPSPCPLRLPRDEAVRAPAGCWPITIRTVTRSMYRPARTRTTRGRYSAPSNWPPRPGPARHQPDHRQAREHRRGEPHPGHQPQHHDPDQRPGDLHEEPGGHHGQPPGWPSPGSSS
jgi:hypothetical protein